LQTAFVGNTTRHLYRGFNANAVRPGTMFIPGTTECCADHLGNGTGDSNEVDYAPFKPFGTIQMNSHSDTSNYNSLQVTARRNVSNGLTLLANYTWSKTLGYTTSFQGVVDPFNAHRDYGYLPWDRSQLFNFSYIYQMPAVAAKHNWNNRFAKGVLDSWQLSGISHIQSGSPLFPNNPSVVCHDITLDPPKSATNPNGDGPNSITNGATQSSNECSQGFFNQGLSVFAGGNNGWYGTNDLALRPFTNWKAGGSPKVGGHWVDPSSLGLPGPGQLGTFETPIYRGPGLWSYDMTLFKTFPLGESRRLEFRIASFDLLNHGNPINPSMGNNWRWDMPANVPSCKSSGSCMPGSPANAFALGTPKLLNGATFGVVTNAYGHREMEMALKFYF